jgi:hypothetical protein
MDENQILSVARHFSVLPSVRLCQTLINAAVVLDAYDLRMNTCKRKLQE